MRLVKWTCVILLASVLAGFSQDVQIKDATPFSYAYLECGGSYQQIPQKISQFMGEFFKQKLSPAGPPLGIYLNSPQQVKTEDLKWQIGMPVAMEAAVAAPLKKGEFQHKKTAVCIHVGPFDKVAESYAKVFPFIEKSGYKVAGPIMEKYLSDPNQVKPEELRTEIVVPVEKKT